MNNFAEFMPHGHCYLWSPEVLWLNVISDAAIALAYFAIPIMLVRFVRKRQDLVFPWIFVLFGAFILFCGATHMMDVYTTWVPLYRAEGYLKAATAVVSVATAVATFQLIPKALALPSPDQLRREVAERKQAEEEVRRLNEELERRVEERTTELRRANEDLEAFVHVVSHDLREPLRAVSNFTRMLEKRYAEKLDDRGREYIHHASEGALRMQAMLTDLVSYSRISEDTPVEEVPLAEVIDEALADLRTHITERGAVVDVPPELPTLQGSRTQLRQLISNLVSNAIKYTPGDAPRVQIEVERTARGHELRVIDHGVGIPDEHKERVLEMFQRLHTRDEIEGSGVGLAICRRIVERGGGVLEIHDTPRSGTTMTVVWPENRDVVGGDSDG